MREVSSPTGASAVPEAEAETSPGAPELLPRATEAASFARVSPAGAPASNESLATKLAA